MPRRSRAATGGSGTALALTLGTGGIGEMELYAAQVRVRARGFAIRHETDPTIPSLQQRVKVSFDVVGHRLVVASP